MADQNLLQELQSLQKMGAKMESMGKRMSERAYAAIVQLEQFSAPAPKGGKKNKSFDEGKFAASVRAKIYRHSRSTNN